METTFYIHLSLKTANGPEIYGRFDIGNDREAAQALFQQLEGSTSIADNSFLAMELMETINGLPVNLQLISCSLDQICANCRIISKELFNRTLLKAQ